MAAYGNGVPIQIEAFQTGEFWTYVWTRDLSYSVYLALGGFDPPRAVNSLLFKTSICQATVAGGYTKSNHSGHRLGRQLSCFERPRRLGAWRRRNAKVSADG